MYTIANAQLLGINMQTVGHVLDWAVFYSEEYGVVLVCHGDPEGRLSEPHHDTIALLGEDEPTAFQDAVEYASKIICCYPAKQENKKALGDWNSKTQSLPFPVEDDEAVPFYWADLVRKIGQRFDVAFGPTGWYL